jgi:hypothetical protein
MLSSPCDDISWKKHAASPTVMNQATWKRILDLGLGMKNNRTVKRINIIKVLGATNHSTASQK